MSIIRMIAAFIITALIGTVANARESFVLKTDVSSLKVEAFTKKETNAAAAAVVILSGSKGFGSAAYDKIGKTFVAAGLDVYLAHLISPEDLRHISTAKNASSRIEYYKQRRKDWISDTRALVSHLNTMPKYVGRVGLLGISLGAETAGIATSEGLQVTTVVLVDGIHSDRQAFTTMKLPPIHLMWGSADTVYPLSSAQRFLDFVNRAGGTATMTVFDGAKHDFFLNPETRQANEAYEDVTEFLRAQLISE